MKLLEGIFVVLLGELFCPTMMMVYVCRINAMTFKSFTKTYTIRNRKLVEILIAEENLWGVSRICLGLSPIFYFYLKSIFIYIIYGYL